MLDAIARTVVRVLITHRKASGMDNGFGSRTAIGREIGGQSGSDGGGSAVDDDSCLLLKPIAFMAALPFLLMWLASPLLMYLLDLPPRIREQSPLTDRRSAMAST